MNKRTGLLLLVVLALAAGLWWTLGRPGGERAAEREAASERAPASGGSLAAKLAAPRPVLDLRRADRSSVAGHVRDPQGRPIAGATVCAFTYAPELSAADRREPRCTTSEADGGYRLEGLFPVPHSVQASAPTFIPQAYEQRELRWNRGNVVLRAGQETRDIDIVLLPGGVEIKGFVRDLSGGELEGAFVSAGYAHTRSGPEGAFSLWVQPGDAGVGAHAEGYADGYDGGVAPGHVFELYLTPEAVLVGRVIRAEDGAPLADAYVSASSGSGGSSGGPAITDASGNFRIDGLPPGAYKATATHDAAYGVAAELVVLGLGETSAPVEIRAHPAYSVDGVVVVAGGDVCDNGNVLLEDPPQQNRSGSLGPDGAVHVRGVLPGTYKVKVYCDGFVSQAEYPALEVVDASVAGLRWEVLPGQSIRGQVTRAGKPIARVQVAAQGVADPAAPRAQTTYAWSSEVDEAGRFELKGLLAGRYRISAWHPDGGGLDKPVEVELREGQDLEGLAIDMPAVGEVRGRVRDAEGRPVGGAQVSLVGSPKRAHGNSADDGSFHLPSVMPGEYRATAMKNWTPMRAPGTGDDDLQGTTVVVAAGEVTTLDLVVEAPSGTISGRVVDADGGPLADAFVEATREAESAAAVAGSALRSTRWGGSFEDRPTLTDPDGRFTLQKLPPGKYTLLAHRRGGGEGSVEHVEVGGSVEIKIAEAGSLSGQVRIVGGGAPQQFTVRVADKRTGYQMRDTFFRTGGAFSIPEVPRGDFEVVVESEEGSGEARVSLGEGEKGQVEVALHPLVTVRGRVVDLESGAPVPGMIVSISARGGANRFGWGDANSKEVTDAEGRYELSDVSSGPVNVLIRPRSWGASEHGNANFPATVASGEGVVELPDFQVTRKRVKDDEAAGDLGFKLREWDPTLEPEQRRARVAFVRPGGPAAQAGLVAGDVIVSVDGHDVTGANLYRYGGLSRVPVGGKLRLGLERGTSVELTAGRAP